MAKKKVNNSSRNQNNDKQQLVIFVAVFMAVLFIGGIIIAVLVGGNTGGSPTGGAAQSGTALENEVKTLTEQVYANPDDVNIQERLGNAYFNLANQYKQTNDPKTNATFGEAIKNYRAVVAKKPTSKEAWGDLATALYYTDQIDAAIEAVQKALKIDPSFEPARMNYAIYLGYGRGDYAGAIKQLEQVSAGSTQYSQAQSMKQEFENALKNPQPNQVQQ